MSVGIQKTNLILNLSSLLFLENLVLGHIYNFCQFSPLFQNVNFLKGWVGMTLAV